MAERALEEYGTKATSFAFHEALEAYQLGIILLRLIGQTDDADLCGRTQDAVDRMIETNWYGVEEDLRRGLGG